MSAAFVNAASAMYWLLALLNHFSRHGDWQLAPQEGLVSIDTVRRRVVAVLLKPMLLFGLLALQSLGFLALCKALEISA